MESTQLWASATSSQLITTVLIQLIVIILAARIFGYLFGFLRQPAVIGEIVAGIVLGPSVLKPLMPEWWLVVFDPATGPIFEVVKEIGLIFLLFLVGMEFEFMHLRAVGKAALSVACAGLIIPFLVGMAVAGGLMAWGYAAPNTLSLALFLGTAFSITALPVLGRILLELGITKSRIGTLTLSAAAVTDAAAWILLANITFTVMGQFDPWRVFWMVLVTVGFVVVMFGAVRPVVLRWMEGLLPDGGGSLSVAGLSAILFLLLLSALVTEMIGIFAIFGAFLFGVAISGNAKLHEGIGDSFRNFVAAFFVPIFFTYTGLRTNLAGLLTLEDWLLLFGISGAAILAKLVSCLLAARWGGYPWKEATCIGLLMNTRGLMELIVINVGFELGIIDQTLFTILVIMSLVTNIMATPLVLLLHRGTELEPWLVRAGFGDARQLQEVKSEAEVEKSVGN